MRENRYEKWSKGMGYGMTVGDGEMKALGEVLDRVRKYDGKERKLVVGVENVGVLKKLRKGRGFCGKWEQEVREWGKELLMKGWDIVLRWVPGHVGVRENEEVDSLAKRGVWMENEKEESVLSWGMWEQRRKERVERVWKEYWKGREKGKAYFEKGGGEVGYGGKRRESIFLVWMRSGHGKMRGTRYGKGDGLCECWEREDRDHVLLKYRLWDKEREVIWAAWGLKGKRGEVVDMRWLLHERDGVEAVRKFGCEKGWIERRWGERREWSRNRKEEWGRLWVEGRKGLVGERAREKRERDLRLGRERSRKRRLLLKSKGEEGGGKCRAGASIASVPTLGVYPGRRRKVLGELRDGGNRRRG